MASLEELSLASMCRKEPSRLEGAACRISCIFSGTVGISNLGLEEVLIFIRPNRFRKDGIFFFFSRAWRLVVGGGRGVMVDSVVVAVAAEALVVGRCGSAPVGKETVRLRTDSLDSWVGLEVEGCCECCVDSIVFGVPGGLEEAEEAGLIGTRGGGTD
jgi:hypothetical protein